MDNNPDFSVCKQTQNTFKVTHCNESLACNEKKKMKRRCQSTGNNYFKIIFVIQAVNLSNCSLEMGIFFSSGGTSDFELLI